MSIVNPEYNRQGNSIQVAHNGISLLELGITKRRVHESKRTRVGSIYRGHKNKKQVVILARQARCFALLYYTKGLVCKLKFQARMVRVAVALPEWWKTRYQEISSDLQERFCLSCRLLTY